MTSAEAECIFCKIVRGELPAREVERAEDYVAFNDIAPQAPIHVLIVPTSHAATLSAFAMAAGPTALGRLLDAAARIGTRLGPHGYRIVINEGVDGHQTVGHLHLHVLAGRKLGWPPG